LLREIERLRAALEEVLKMSADVPSEDGGELLEALCKRALGNEQKADGQLISEERALRSRLGLRDKEGLAQEPLANPRNRTFLHAHMRG
jgi:hypothetical protein